MASSILIECEDNEEEIQREGEEEIKRKRGTTQDRLNFLTSKVD